MGQAMLYTDRVRRIKEVKAANGYSCQQIVDLVLDRGGYTSLGTVKKVTGPDAEHLKFKDITLKSIENGLGIIDEEVHLPSSSGSTDKLLEDLIRELYAQLKVSRRAHLWKNVAIIFLSTLLGVLLLVDRFVSTIGWYREDSNFVWSFFVFLLLVFLLAAVVYNIFQKRNKRQLEESAEKAADL